MLDQCPYIERLGQEADSPRIQCLRPDPFFRERRDENDRYVASPDLQMPLELDTAHPRHFDVCDQAGVVTNLGRPQKFVGRREGTSNVS